MNENDRRPDSISEDPAARNSSSGDPTSGDPAAGGPTSADPASGDASLDVDILVFDEVRMYDVATALEVFSDRSARGLPPVNVRLVGSQPSVRCDSGAVLTVDTGAVVPGPAESANQRPPRLLVVPGSEMRLGRLAEADLTRVRTFDGVVAALCTGAFTLAEAGLLTGRRATTHWRFADELATRFPETEVVPDEIFVGADRVWTSAGVSAGGDLLLHLADEAWGAAVAADIARSMVLPLRRAGNQAQFVDRSALDLARSASANTDFHDLEAHVTAAPQEDWSVRRFARELGLTERTCFRTFRDLTGLTPHEWLTAIRLDVARQLLETTALPIDHVAADSGLGSGDNLRKHFAAKFGMAPNAYRATFAARAGTAPR
ncbi:helix-turn-helix domain-containing protein [Brevibacterium ammoniilyticum]|uniref:Helix-turn-helix domain-containing protein n=1 Tax=Brevibacterium ammoniilyticum TaxID=1046555 RepID=A0ABP9U1K6_9MICO